MDRHEIYCQKGFLENLYSKLDRTMMEFLEQGGDLINMYKMIHYRTDLKIDLDKEEFIELCRENPNYKKLLKAGTVNLENRPESFRQMEEDENYFVGRSKEYYFLDKSVDYCHLMEENYGLIFVPANKIEQYCGFLFNPDYEKTHKHKNPANWSFLKKYHHPFNAMIITDGFLLKRSLEEIELNLLHFLKNLLPENLLKASHFDLLIITKEVESLQEKYAFINKKLAESFNYSINLSVIKTEESRFKVHDRNILTNYLWISSGNTFSLFKKNFKNNQPECCLDTTIGFLPRSFTSNKFNSYGESPSIEDNSEKKVLTIYNELLENIRVVINKAKESGSYITLFGSGENRLLND